jgi:hypothetical protein
LGPYECGPRQVTAVEIACLDPELAQESCGRVASLTHRAVDDDGTFAEHIEMIPE